MPQRFRGLHRHFEHAIKVSMFMHFRVGEVTSYNPPVTGSYMKILIWDNVTKLQFSYQLRYFVGRGKSKFTNNREKYRGLRLIVPRFWRTKIEPIRGIGIIELLY